MTLVVKKGEEGWLIYKYAKATAPGSRLHGGTHVGRREI
jgi:hypothetical protein